MLKINYNLIVSLSCLIYSSVGFSQQLDFVREYHIGHHSNAFSFIQLPDSGYILVGTSAQFAWSNSYSFAMRLNKFGDTIWTRRYIPFEGQIAGIVNYDSSSYIISNGFIIPGGLGITLAKINLNGDTLLRREYGILGNGYGGGIIKVRSGGFLMGNAVASNYGFLKLDSFLDEQWHTYQNMYYGCSDIASDFSNGFVAVGGGNTFSTRYEVARLDSVGGIIWQYKYGNQPTWDQTLEHFATNVVVMPDSNYLVGTDGYDWQLMKINYITGDTMWTRNYLNDTIQQPNDNYRVFSMDYAGDNRYILAGMYFTLIDEIGDSIWKVENTFHLFPSDVHKTSDGGFAICGQIHVPNSTDLPIGFVKLDSLGNTVFTSVFNPENSFAPLTFYPNPATTNITMSYGTLATEKNVVFTLSDMQGRRVLQQPYQNNTAIDISVIPAGLYIATLRGKEKELRGKVMVEK